MQSFVKICRSACTAGRRCGGSSWRSAAGGGIPRSPHPPHENRINRDRDLALPASRLMVPVRTALFPAIGNPVIAAPLAHPTSRDPDVRMIAPLPVTRRPDITDARRRYDLDANRRRRDVDVDADGDAG